MKKYYNVHIHPSHEILTNRATKIEVDEYGKTRIYGYDGNKTILIGIVPMNEIVTLSDSSYKEKSHEVPPPPKPPENRMKAKGNIF